MGRGREGLGEGGGGSGRGDGSVELDAHGRSFRRRELPLGPAVERARDRAVVVLLAAVVPVALGEYPTSGPCPQLIPEPDTCPGDLAGLPLCNEVGRNGGLCVTSDEICPDQLGITTTCVYKVLRIARRALAKVHQSKASADADARRLTAHAECTGDHKCYVAQVGEAVPTGVPSRASDAPAL